MNVTQSIEAVVQRFKNTDELRPSHCDVRCMINDMTRDNDRINKHGYDQDRAWLAVRRKLGTPVTLSQCPYRKSR